MRKIRVVARGAYGKIYECADKEGKSSIVKRNIVDEQTNGACSMREIDILLQLRGHPFIVDIQSVAIGSPFVDVLSPAARSGEKDDLIHMVLEKASYSLRDLIANGISAEQIKLAACHSLLALEYSHAHGIIHRDIKSENILVFAPPGISPRLAFQSTSKQSLESRTVFKLCDFGLSKIMTKALPSTPKTVTYTHRAPEIICQYPYSFKCDLWSMGCVIYEMACGTLPFKLLGDNDVHLLQTILKDMHYQVDEKELRKLCPTAGSESQKRVDGKARESGLQDVKNDICVRRSLGARLPQCDTQMVDLLQHLLVFDPDSRYDASEALQHKYFDSCRALIDDVRKRYIPQVSKYDITIRKCLERKWACELALSIYDINEKFDWYYDRALFQAIDLFDRYLAIKMMDESKLHKDEIDSNDSNQRGRVHTRKEACSIFTCCLYMATKYFTTVYAQCSFVDIVSCTGVMEMGEDAITQLEDFELMFLWKCLNYRLYRETCLEVAGRDRKLEDNEIKDLLTFYASLGRFEASNGESIHRAYMKSKGTSR